MNETLLHGKAPFELLSAFKDRISFIYLEYGNVVREGNSLIFKQNNFDYDLPCAKLSFILLGNGTTISQPAMAEISRWGCNVSFVNGSGLGLHSSHISPLSKSAKNIIKQAEIVSNNSLRLKHARQMYRIRWGEAGVPKSYSLKELMALEGSRVRKTYKKEAEKYGIKNFTRKQLIDYESDDRINQLLTTGYNLIYGLCNTAITSLGLSPALGVIHHGHSQSFVFDIADFYKEKIIIPFCFQQYGEGSSSSDLRKEFRKYFISYKMISQIIEDIYLTLNLTLEEEKEEKSFLWDSKELIDNQGSRVI